MEQPSGFEFADCQKFVLCLRKTIYGLKQSSRKWYKKLTAALGTLGFKPLKKDHTVYCLVRGPDIIILAIHVDDCTITGSSSSLINNTQDCIAQLFKITLLGPISWLLGLEIIRNRAAHTISLNQTSYINSVLQRFNMEACKPSAIPMNPNVQLSRNQCPTDALEIAEMQQHPYRGVVESLIWITTGTCPDLAYAATILLHFNNKPGLIHWHAAKCAMQYFKATCSWRLTFGGDGQGRGLKGYADADRMSMESCKVISGYAFLIDGGAVLWSSKQQDIIALSTTEAEYIVLTYTSKEALWMQQFILELFLPLHNPIIIHDNNQSALAFAHAKLGQFHPQTKHIDIWYHFIWYTIQNNNIRLTYLRRQNILPGVLNLFRLEGEYWNIRPYSPVRTLFPLHPNHPLHCFLMDS